MSFPILFIHPGSHKKTYQGLAAEFSAIDTPIWEPLLAGYLRNEGYEVAIYDVNVEGWTATTANELLGRYQPGLIVIMVFGHNPSASTQTMPAAAHLATDLKAVEKDVLIAMGGTHPSAIPKRTLLEENVDFVIQGEGAFNIRDLVEYLIGRKKASDVQNIWYKSNDTIKPMGIQGDTINNLDDIFPDYAWDLLPPLDHYRAHNWHCFQYFADSQQNDFADVRMPYVSLYTAFGCPYSCRFCCINAVFGRPGIRYWSIDTVVSWIDRLVNVHGIRNIRIADELFILAPKRIERFCDLLIERQYNLNIWAYGTIDTSNTSLLKKLRQAGLRWVCLGIEVGNKMVMDNVNKHIKQDVRDVIKRIQESGIYVIGNYMFGLPEDNLNTMGETFALAKQLNCEFANFYSAMPYPGSELYTDAIASGFPIENWSQFSQHSYDCTPLPTRYLKSAAVLQFRDQSFMDYFSDDRYQRMIHERFGDKVVEHLQRMLAIQVKRKIIS